MIQFCFFVSWDRYVCRKFKHHRTVQCQAKGKIVNDQVVLFPNSDEHKCDHIVNEILAQIESFEHALFDAVVENNRKTAFEIYETVSQR